MGTEFDEGMFARMSGASSDADLTVDDEETSEGDSTEEFPEGTSDDEAYDDEVIDDDEGEEDGSEDIEASDKSELAALLREMRTEIVELREQLNNKKAEGDAEAAPAAPMTIDFVDDALFEEAVSSKDGLNKLLNVVHQAGHAAALQLLPELIREGADQAIRNHSLIENFYRSNPDLDKVRPLVQAVAKEVSAEMSGEKDARKVFLEIAKRSRARIKGTSQSKIVPGGVRKNPGHVPATAARPGNGRPGKKKSTIADEMARMRDL